MSLTYPDSQQQKAKQVYSSPASGEAYIRVPVATLVDTPGDYTVSVNANPGSSFALRVQTPSTSIQVAAADAAALRAIQAACCRPDTSSQACSVYLPAASQGAGDVSFCELGPNACDAQGRVTKLVLGGAEFECSKFPGAFSNLTALETLDLARSGSFGNATLDSIAQVLAPLTTLSRVSLARTGVTGTIPCALADARSLRRLSLAFNPGINGSLPACILEARVLEEFDASSTSLTGSLPEAAALSKSLVSLYLRNDRGLGGLSGTIPVSYASLPSLAFLNLADHQLAGPLPRLPDGLRLVNLTNNMLTGSVPALPRTLQYLSLMNNQLFGPLPDTSEAITLEHLDLSFNRLSGVLPPSFSAAAPTLRYLDVGNNTISGRLDVTDWAELEQLGQLGLYNNLFTGPLASNLAMLPKLYSLSVAGNQLIGGLDEFAMALPEVSLAAETFSGLLRLDVSSNQLTGSIPERMSNLLMMQNVPIQATDTPGNSFPPRVFDVSRNQLWGVMPDFFIQALPDAIITCQCQFDLEWRGNAIFCPPSSQLGTTFALPPSSAKALKSLNVTCILPTTTPMTQVPLEQYLAQPPINFSIPDVPLSATLDGGGGVGPPPDFPLADASPQAISGGGGGSGGSGGTLSAADMAGIAVGVAVAVGGIAGIIFLAATKWRPKAMHSATSFESFHDDDVALASMAGGAQGNGAGGATDAHEDAGEDGEDVVGDVAPPRLRRAFSKIPSFTSSSRQGPFSSAGIHGVKPQGAETRSSSFTMGTMGTVRPPLRMASVGSRSAHSDRAGAWPPLLLDVEMQSTRREEAPPGAASLPPSISSPPRGLSRYRSSQL